VTQPTECVFPSSFPRATRTSLETCTGVAEPTVFLGLVRIQVVQHDMNLATGVVGYDFIHEIQEFPPATPGVVRSLDQVRW